MFCQRVVGFFVFIVALGSAGCAAAVPEPDPQPGAAGGPAERPPPPLASHYVLHGLRTLVGGTPVSETGRKYFTAAPDMSAVYVKTGARLNLIGPDIRTSGNTSSGDNSSFFGLNAAVLATEGGLIYITGGQIITSGSGANGLFATGSGAMVTMAGGTISASGDGAHGLMTSLGGEIAVTDIRVATLGAHAAPIATDRGGGRVTVLGGVLRSAGEGSPGIYSTGEIRVTAADIQARGAEGAVIEGSNSIALENTTLRGEKLAGVMIYQSFSGDAEGHEGRFRMRGGNLSAGQGPLFYVTNATGVIELENVALESGSGVLVRAAADRWGQAGHNGGHAKVLARYQVMHGDVLVESGSSISLSLDKESVLYGRISRAALHLDASSKWVLTADSELTVIEDAEGVSSGTVSNIVGNGHSVRYDAKSAANAPLHGKTYTLQGGGQLAPQ